MSPQNALLKKKKKTKASTKVKIKARIITTMHKYQRMNYDSPGNWGNEYDVDKSKDDNDCEPK